MKRKWYISSRNIEKCKEIFALYTFSIKRAVPRCVIKKYFIKRRCVRVFYEWQPVNGILAIRRRAFGFSRNLFSLRLRVDKGWNGWSTNSNPRWRSSPEKPGRRRETSKLPLSAQHERRRRWGAATSRSNDYADQKNINVPGLVRNEQMIRCGRRSPNWILRNLLLTGLQERTFPLRGNCLCNRTLGSRSARIYRTGEITWLI